MLARMLYYFAYADAATLLMPLPPLIRLRHAPPLYAIDAIRYMRAAPYADTMPPC